MPKPRQVVTLATALWDEFCTIHREPPPAIIDHSGDAGMIAYQQATQRKEQTALCLSGGGIRSAAFALGVIQALARKGLLTQFHYLSTVSGGGYIGGWLTALIHENRGNVDEVQTKLTARRPTPEIASLRAFTNFLTPNPGFASTDTWAAIVLSVRNVLVNWMLFLPALFALACLPVLYRDLIDTLSFRFGAGVLLAALVSLFVGVYVGAAHLPSHARAPTATDPSSMHQQAQFVRNWVMWPILIWACLAPIVAAPSLCLVMPEGTVSAFLIPAGCFVVMIAAYVAASLGSHVEGRRLYRRNFGWWTLAALSASVVLDVGMNLSVGLPPFILAIFGPLWVTLAHLVQSLVYVALRRDGLRGDLDREWLARLSAVKVVPALIWAVFAAVCLWLPCLILHTGWPRLHAWIVAAVAVLTGPGAAYIGKSAAATFGDDEKDAGGTWYPSASLVATVGTVIFAALLFMLLGRAADLLTDAFAPRRGGEVPGYRVLVDVAFFLVTLGMAYALGERINVNRFSMHAVYRTRLVRAFLGSARTARTPDGFTGIDPQDNPRMTDMFDRDTQRALFPVINVALNLTTVRNNAWAERKAESFTITPLACGAADLYRREDLDAGLTARGAYATTSAYGGRERQTGTADPAPGISLGTAMTLSGAAVSPNMGYHSSPATAFLMTLFNVRLGAWLPNPALASAAQLREAGPPNALRTLAAELRGQSDDVGRAVNLSDGGHFENLGLYEMIRRRCRYVVVVDAGQDGGAKFGDLGNTVRKVLIDFGVEIDFEPIMAIGSRDKPIPPVRGDAYARIKYNDGGPDGELIYLRPFDMTEASMGVRAYRNSDAAFPHDSTLDQWFSESRFESYRSLGEEEMARLGCDEANPAAKPASLAAFFAAVRKRPPRSTSAP